MEHLTYEQKLILSLYKEVFNEEYDFSEQAKQNMQNFVFLLQLKGINIGDFGYF